MPVEFELKLQDLVNIALGSPQLTHVNIAVLQSLIQILLKKLNCQDEAVTLNSYESKHLENMLKNSKTSPLIFNEDHIQIINEKLERLDNLQEFVNNLDGKLNRHLEELQRKSNFSETVFQWDNWPSCGCEDLCTTCDPENDMACKILKNTDFLKKLLRRISSPMVDRMFYFEEKIKKLYEEFSSFIEKAEEEFLKIQLLEKCIVEIENLRKNLEEHQTQFMNAMEEIQDMLDSKLDKIHMSALKKYIHDNFQHIDSCINNLQDKKQCHRAAGIIIEGIRCVSCGNTGICSEVGVQSASMLPDVKVKSQILEKYCGNSSLLKGVDVGNKTIPKSLNLGDVIKMRVKKSLRELEDKYPRCRKGGEEFDLVEGINGHLYRKG